MAVRPTFASTPILGVASVSTANTNRDGTGTIADIGTTAPAAGQKGTSLVIKATGDPADSIVTVYVYDGSTYQLWDEFDLGDPAAASTTVIGYRDRKTYDDLVLPTGYKVGMAITVALTSGVIKGWKLAGDLT